MQFLAELNRLRNEAVPADELNMVKNVMTGNFARSLEDPATRYALNIARFNLPADYYANYLKNLSMVTAEDIKAMAAKYIVPGTLRYTGGWQQGRGGESLASFPQTKKCASTMYMAIRLNKWAWKYPLEPLQKR